MATNISTKPVVASLYSTTTMHVLGRSWDRITETNEIVLNATRANEYFELVERRLSTHTTSAIQSIYKKAVPLVDDFTRLPSWYQKYDTVLMPEFKLPYSGLLCLLFNPLDSHVELRSWFVCMAQYCLFNGLKYCTLQVPTDTVRLAARKYVVESTHFFASVYMQICTSDEHSAARLFKAMRKYIGALAIKNEPDLYNCTAGTLYLELYKLVLMREVIIRMLPEGQLVHTQAVSLNKLAMKLALASMKELLDPPFCGAIVTLAEDIMEKALSYHNLKPDSEEKKAIDFVFDSLKKCRSPIPRRRVADLQNFMSSSACREGTDPPPYVELQSGLDMKSIQKMISIAKVQDKNLYLDSIRSRIRKGKSSARPHALEKAERLALKNKDIAIKKRRDQKYANVETQSFLPGSWKVPVDLKFENLDKVEEIVEKVSNKTFQHNLTFEDDAKLLFTDVVGVLSKLADTGVKVDVGSTLFESVVESIKGFITRHGKLIIIALVLCACVFIMVTLIKEESSRRMFLIGVGFILTALYLKDEIVDTAFKYLEKAFDVKKKIFAQDGIGTAYELGVDPNMLSKAIGTVLIGSTMKNLSYNYPLEDFMRRCGSIKKAQEGATHIMGLCLSIFQDCVNFTLDLFGSEKRLTLYCHKYPEVAKFGTTVTKILRDFDEGRETLNTSFSGKVQDLVSFGNALMSRLDSSNEGKDAKSTMHYELARLNPLVQKLRRINLFGGGPRQEPVGVMICGGTDIGKTTCSLMMMYEIAAKTMPPEKLQELEENPNSCYYNRIFENEFWDGYANQWITFFDDATQVRDIAGSLATPYMESVRTINVNPFSPHMAHLEEKGQVNFCSKFVFMTSNLTRCPELQSIVCPKAFIRRYRDTWFAYVRNEYAVNPGALMTDRKFDVKNCKIEPGCPHLAFRRLDLYTGAVDSKDYTYQEVVDSAIKRFGTSFAKHESLNSVLMSSLKGAINARKTQMSMADIAQDMKMKVGLDIKVQSGAEIVDEIVEDRVEYENNVDILPSTTFSHFYDKTEAEALTYLSQVEETHYGVLSQFNYREVYEPFPNALKIFDKHCKTGRAGYDAWLWLQCMNQLQMSFVGDYDLENSDFLNLYGKILPVNLFNPQKVTEMLIEWQEEWDKHRMNVKRGKSAKVPESKVRMMDRANGLFASFKDKIAAHRTLLVKVGKLMTVITGATMLYRYLTRNDPQSSHRGVSKGSRSRIRGATASKDQITMAITQGGTVMKDAEGQVVPQFGSDPTCADVVTKLIKCNMYEIKIPRNDVFLGFCLLIEGHEGVMPQHYHNAVGVMVEEGKLDEGDVMLFRPIVDPKSKAGIEIYVHEFLDMMAVLPDKGEMADVLAFSLPRNKFPPAPSLVHVFVTEDRMPKTGKTVKAMLALPKPGLGAICEVTTATLCGEMTPSNSSFVIPERFDYQIPTQKGWCCSPLMLINKASGGEKIMGIHVAGDSQSWGYALKLSRENVTDLYKLFGKDEQLSKVGVVQCGAFKSGIDDLGGFVALRKDKKAPLPRKTKIIPSPLYNKVGFVPKTKPAYLYRTPRDLGSIDVLEVARSKYDHTCKAMSSNLYDLCCESYLNQLTKRCPKIKMDIDRMLTFREAVEGIAGNDYVNGIPRNTSPGYPYIFDHKGQPGKTAWFGVEGEYDFNSAACKKLEQEVESIIANGRVGIRMEHIYLDFPKDERRPIEKVNEGKTRSVSGAPLGCAIAIRMAFGGMLAWLMRSYIQSGIAVGINPYSSDWQAMVDYLQSNGDDEIRKFLAGDFKHYDGSLTYMIMRILLLIADWFYGKEERVLRETLFLDVANSLHIIEDIIYRWHSGMPSGNPLTAILNSLCNNCIIRYAACLEYFEQENLNIALKEEKAMVHAVTFLEEFEKYVRIATYGDDNLISVAKHLRNYISMKLLTKNFGKFGFEYTDESKSSSEVGFRTIEEVTFLKRGFRYDSDLYRYVAPLSLDTVLEFLQWTKEADIPSNWEFTKGNVDKCLEELAFHDRAVFDEWSVRVVEAAKQELGYAPASQSYLVCKMRNASADYSSSA